MDRDLTDFAYPGACGLSSSDENRTSRQTPSQTVKELAEIQENVEHFANNVAILQEKSEYLDTPQETDQLWDEIIQLAADTVKMAEIPTSSIEKVRQQSRKMSVSDRNTFEGLMSTYASSGVRFKKLRRMTLDLEQKRKLAASRRQPSIASCDKTESSPSDAVGHKLQSETSLEAHTEQVEVEERAQNIIQDIEKDILDINELFGDSVDTVHEQGENVNHIETSVDVSTGRVEHGNTQFEKSASAKRCSRKLKLAISTVAAVITMAIGAVVLLGVLEVYTVN